MTINGWSQIVIFCGLVFLFVKPFGAYMANVFDGRRTLLSPVLRPIEHGIYALCGVNERQEQHWVSYAISVLLFSVAGFIAVYLLQRLQGSLPLNPAGMSAVEQSSSFNTAASFASNTNWQGYGGEATMSYLTQMMALTTQNFVSAAAGIAVAIALVRGFARRSAQTIGNFWIDLTRSTLYVLLPLSIVVALVLIASGVPQNLGAYTEVSTLENARQVIAQGPVASQVAIKQLGTNGGGFFNANSAHPLENPNELSNLMEMWSILAIAAALTYTFGRMIGSQRQGWAIFAIMGVLFLPGMTTCYWAEAQGNPTFAQFQVDHTPGAMQAGGNMEGKEVRFGIAGSTIWATATTAASNGSVNSMHDSYTPLGGMVPLINIAVGEIIFGGVGSGLYGMLLFVVLAMFIAGLMVGRTPEYLGKKLEAKEVKMAILAILIVPLSILGFTALASVLPAGLAGPLNAGPHGFSEILYAFTSSSGNNGSAFAGLTANTQFYNTTIGLSMLIGRFMIIVPVLAIAGSLVRKNSVPPSSGTFPTDGGLFVGLVCGVIVIESALAFFPALSVGPIVEHLAMLAGTLY